MEILKICFFHVTRGPKRDIEPNFHEYDLKCQRLPQTTENGPISNIGTLWQPPLKMEILKICFFHVTRGPKRDIEPNFYEHTTSNVKDYPRKTENGPISNIGTLWQPP